MSNHESSTVIPAVMIDASAKGWRLFRNSRGVAYVGKKAGDVIRPGGKKGIILVDVRRVNYGLTDGASDLIGWRPVVITPDMVGKTIAQFCAVECKTLAYPDTTPDQDNFLDQVAQAGGYAAIAMERRAGNPEVIPVEAD